jgi:hypothetical protein
MSDNPPSLLSQIELQRIVTMPEAERLSSLSADTIRRHHRDKILKLSPKREGMRLRDALMLKEKTTA